MLTLWHSCDLESRARSGEACWDVALRSKLGLQPRFQIKCLSDCLSWKAQFADVASLNIAHHVAGVSVSAILTICRNKNFLLGSDRACILKFLRVTISVCLSVAQCLLLLVAAGIAGEKASPIKLGTLTQMRGHFSAPVLEGRMTFKSLVLTMTVLLMD